MGVVSIEVPGARSAPAGLVSRGLSRFLPPWYTLFRTVVDWTAVNQMESEGMEPVRDWTGTIVGWKPIDRFGHIGPHSRPGGGGPGHSLTSTDPPLSLEATGASLAQLGKTEGPARSSKRGSRPRRKCKPGYRWNGHRCVPKY